MVKNMNTGKNVIKKFKDYEEGDIKFRVFEYGAIIVFKKIPEDESENFKWVTECHISRFELLKYKAFIQLAIQNRQEFENKQSEKKDD